jgi:hypothetical protein
MNYIKTFEQFSINEEDTSRSNGYVPGTLKREFEDMPEGTELSIDALSYSQSANDDLVICFVNDDMIRVPKSRLELEDGEGI